MRETRLPSVEGTLGPQKGVVVVTLSSTPVAERKRVTQSLEDMCQNDPWKIRKSALGRRGGRKIRRAVVWRGVTAAGTSLQKTRGSKLGHQAWLYGTPAQGGTFLPMTKGLVHCGCNDCASWLHSLWVIYWTKGRKCMNFWVSYFSTHMGTTKLCWYALP